MKPIRSRTPQPAREPLAGSHLDAVQPSADQGASTPASAPLDGLPARRTVSRGHLPPSPARLSALSTNSFDDLHHQVDLSQFKVLPSFGAEHAQAATEGLDEAQSPLLALDDPPSAVGLAAMQSSARTCEASPEAHEDLSTLGYSQSQQEKIKPQVRSTVAQHHHALIGHGFTHAHIVELSKHPAALGTVAARYPDIIATLPEATHEDIVVVGKQQYGAKTLETLLKVATALREPPLQLVTGQLIKIAKRGGAMALQAVHAWRNVLTAPPLRLTPAQVVAIASNGGSKQALEAVQRLMPVLCEEHGLTPDQVVSIASHDGGKQALEAVRHLLPVLCKEHGLTPDQVVTIANRDGGKQALKTVQCLLPGLCRDHGLSVDQVVAVASNHGGKLALETVQRLLPVLCNDHGLTPRQVVAIASHDGGKQALETVQRLLPVLCNDHGLTRNQVVAIARNIGGKQALETVQRLLPSLLKDHGLVPEQVVAIASNHGGKLALETVQCLLPVLCKDHRLSPEQVVAIASNHGGRQALETVHRLLPVLCKDHGLTTKQVVAIASNDGGKQALETVQRLLPALCKEHGLTTDQVVAIASNNGGKQALETVQRLLPRLCKDHRLSSAQVIAIASNIGGKQALEAVQHLLSKLCKDHGLTPEQVVAIASHDGGKQALEAVQRLLPELCEEHGLTTDQVVAIASHDGGKQALDALQRLLPVLCNEHGLAPYQVVAIASNGGGRQALESLFAQLSRPDPALAALSNDRLVALTCLGGRPALEAVIKGLPHAPMLIRRANRRVLDHTSRRAADVVHVVQVLSFFQCHSHPERAFDEAMQQFGMSRRELLKVLRRVGVTELEACNGTLPPTSQRWQRILHALGKQSSSVSSPRQESSHAFADALEHESDAPSPMQEAGQALICTSRKRLRSDDALHRSQLQPAQAQDPEQPDALDAHLPSGWSRKRSRTKIGHGLLDPGTPTDADLEASNTLFVGQDAATFASTEEDFPAFDDEEMEWLMELLP